MREEGAFEYWGQITCVHILAVPLISCVTLAELCQQVPQFPSYEMGIITIHASQGGFER